MSSIGKNIRYYRKYKGITQEKLAMMVGCATITIQQYEAEKYQPKIDKLQKIANALDIPITKLDETLYQNSFDKNVGNNIAIMRKRIGISKSDLAKLLNTSSDYIENLENGKIHLKIEDIEQIAKKMNVHMLSLLSGADFDYNNLTEDKSQTGKEITKRLAIVKFLDCIFKRADLTKMKIYSKEDGNNIYNEEYVSYDDGSACDDLVIDYSQLDTLINIFENICRNILPSLSKREEAKLADQKYYYELFRESIELKTIIKKKYESLNDIEIKQIQKEIEKYSNHEEFVSIDINPNPPAT